MRRVPEIGAAMLLEVLDAMRNYNALNKCCCYVIIQIFGTVGAGGSLRQPERRRLRTCTRM